MGNQLNGLLLVDKPADMTSARLVAVIKKTVGRETKVGHTGTLDPFATGLMIICLGNATRLARFFLHSDKQYQALMVLGQETDTLDGAGRVIASSEDIDRSPTEIDAVMQRFTGRILQEPPVYSALKHKGTPLYKLARQGTPIQKPPREVRIDTVRLIAVDLPEVAFSVACSSGTYIRSLCRDMGRALGCGAYLQDLRRTRSGGFAIEQALALETIEDLVAGGGLADRVICPSRALDGMSTVVADAADAAKIRHGQLLGKAFIENDRFIPGATAAFDGFTKIEDAAGDLLAVVEQEKSTGFYRYCCVFS